MITIQTLFQVGGALQPMKDFHGPFADPDYIEGAIELTIDRRPLLTREQVDYVDQLWAYLVDGLDAVATGRDFSTFYPDMPVQIELRPRGNGVTVKVDMRSKVIEATAPRREFIEAMVLAATAFFTHLASIAPSERASCTQLIARLAALQP